MREEVKEGIIITVVVLLILLIAYLSTAIFATGEIGGKSKKTTTTKSDSITELYDDMILASNTFNKSGEYMVIFFSEKDVKKVIKNAIEKYDDENIKLYKVNTDEAVNKFVLSEEENPNATNEGELKIKGTTLITINNNKITSYTTEKDQILEKLK